MSHAGTGRKVVFADDFRPVVGAGKSANEIEHAGDALERRPRHVPVVDPSS
jgi:hypothetical protein